MSSPIRDKFVEHMKFHGLTHETQRGYISGVRCLADSEQSETFETLQPVPGEVEQ